MTNLNIASYIDWEDILTGSSDCSNILLYTFLDIFHYLCIKHIPIKQQYPKRYRYPIYIYIKQLNKVRKLHRIYIYRNIILNIMNTQVNK